MIPDNCQLNMKTKTIVCLKLTNIYSLYKQTSDQPHVLYCKLFCCKNFQVNYYSILILKGESNANVTFTLHQIKFNKSNRIGI